MKKLFCLICFTTILIVLFPNTAKAASDNACWTRVKEDTWILQDGQGTDLKASLKDNALYISGKGAIPNYSELTLGNRPWHEKGVFTIFIEKGVTSIGAHAFSNFPRLYNVDMYSNTFIEDSTAFAGAAKDCMFHVFGTDMARRDIGRIPFTSMDQFVTVMRKYNYDYRFYFANLYMTQYVKQGVTPAWYKIYPMDATSTDQNPEYPLKNFDSAIICNTPDDSYATSYIIENYRQGKAALQAFDAFMGDNTFGCTYTMAAYKRDVKVEKASATPMQYVISIPAVLRYPGRQFSLLQIGKGVVNILPDLDSCDDTMTFMTDCLSTGYALVYKD